MANTTIATWNVNSVRARLENVMVWLKKYQPDIVCLQEIKATTENFPFFDIESCGYSATIVGQKSYNGVAILTKGGKPDAIHHEHLPFFDGLDTFESKDEPQARYIEITFKGCRVASIYLPNGNPIGTEKFDYKLEWMERLYTHMKTSLLYADMPIILCGDYNVIPRDMDCVNPNDWKNDALFQPETIAAYQKLQTLGFYDAYQSLYPLKENPFTFWDYTAGSWQRGNGIRIDHFLLNPYAMDKLQSCTIHKDERGQDKASDHVPVVIEVKG